MAKNDNLKDFLTDVADAIREKKGSTDLINPQDFSSEIASIQSGGDIWGFDEIGYTPENSPIKEWVECSRRSLGKWENGELINFRNIQDLVFCSYIDAHLKTDVSYFFFDCRALVYIQGFYAPNATNWEYTFKATVIRQFPPLDVGNVLSLRETFSYNYSLMEVGSLNSIKCENFRSTFYNNISLKRIESIDFSSIANMLTTFSGCLYLRYMKVTNLGKSSLTSYDFSGATNWGVATTEIPDARQSLIDSLITYSYDRASNGMETATIKLSATTKALLTEEEIAQITNKGFTIA